MAEHALSNENIVAEGFGGIGPVLLPMSGIGSIQFLLLRLLLNAMSFLVALFCAGVLAFCLPPFFNGNWRRTYCPHNTMRVPNDTAYR